MTEETPTAGEDTEPKSLPVGFDIDNPGDEELAARLAREYTGESEESYVADIYSNWTATRVLRSGG